ncbi:uncharacterized protein LOC124136850 [Haliotis rufescens]|uniref:uncharacterized protein LOC124136850 n=1 Tax=Haliotis rufescens TaxID=6454 RepID=UPI001EAFC8A4|nr:uncharacterized protein LOC124136850 [Haliotis rufescens]
MSSQSKTTRSVAKQGVSTDQTTGRDVGPCIAGSHPGCRYAPYAPDGSQNNNDSEGDGAYIAGSHPGCKYAPNGGQKNNDPDGDGAYIAGSHPGCRYAPYAPN